MLAHANRFQGRWAWHKKKKIHIKHGLEREREKRQNKTYPQQPPPTSVRACVWARAAIIDVERKRGFPARTRIAIAPRKRACAKRFVCSLSIVIIVLFFIEAHRNRIGLKNQSDCLHLLSRKIHLAITPVVCCCDGGCKVYQYQLLIS